ncbi:hypothetical protein Vretimale_727 [Volvox reticuliferus]|uniref:Uncharacterized protein n=1 Tax=Volvox reticuliferus TaxID=1737510 RepID=A0A8J4D833_9CHLO|nr:hypothetical protein Vretimale_727 [Volvox reticuliferus]GIL94762.1 hypothetical protein Vretimale_727 [Volvox reticuliferus]
MSPSRASYAVAHFGSRSGPMCPPWGHRSREQYQSVRKIERSKQTEDSGHPCTYSCLPGFFCLLVAPAVATMVLGSLENTCRRSCLAKRWDEFNVGRGRCMLSGLGAGQRHV